MIYKKKMHITKKEIMSFCINVIFFSLIICSQVMAAGKTSNIKLDFSRFTSSEEDIAGRVLSPLLEYDKASDSLNIAFNTSEYQQGYYTATVFKNLRVRLGDRYGSVIFSIVNNNSQDIRMNFSFLDSEYRAVAAGNDFYVRLQQGNNEKYSKVNYGCFDVPADFEGTVEIPFEILYYQDTNRKLSDIDVINGYGFICVTEENQEYDITVSNMSFLDLDDSVDPREYCIFAIEGEEEVFLPRVGKSETYYNCTSYNMLGEKKNIEAVFSLDKEYEDIDISENGALTVTGGCKEENFIIKAAIGENTMEKVITLYESWTVSAITENGYDASLAKPEEIEPIVKFDTVLGDDRFLWTIRGIFITVGILFMIYYIYVRRKDRAR